MAITTELLLELAQEFQRLAIGQDRVASIQGLIAQSNTAVAQAGEQRLGLDDHPASYARWAQVSAPRS
jgi:hypothetical protein